MLSEPHSFLHIDCCANVIDYYFVSDTDSVTAELTCGNDVVKEVGCRVPHTGGVSGQSFLCDSEVAAGCRSPPSSDTTYKWT